MLSPALFVLVFLLAVAVVVLSGGWLWREIRRSGAEDAAMTDADRAERQELINW